MIQGGAVLFSEMTPPAHRENAFNDWYDGHHSPSHVKGVPGFISAMRYKSDSGPHYLAVYELENPETLQHEEYKKRKLTPDNPTYKMLKSVSGFTRYVAREKFSLARDLNNQSSLDAEFIYCIFFSVPAEQRLDFGKWFDEEHAAMLQRDSNWLLSRRMEIVNYDPEPYTDMILHYLSDDSLLESEEYSAAQKTDWGQEFAKKTWFEPHCVLYRRRRSRFLKVSCKGEK